MAKIYIFSGDDLVSSRQAYLDQINLFKKDNQTEFCLAKDLSEILLENIFGSTDLFGKSRVLTTENFFTGSKSKEKDQLVKKINSFKNAIMVSWETKEVSKTESAKLGKEVSISNFKLPNLLFKFLDTLSPQNKKQNLFALQQLKQTVDEQFIFLMIVRQVRLLLLAHGGETDKIAPWQKSKLVNQARSFGQDKLIALYKQLLNLDIKQKTSQLGLSLGSELDLLVSGL